MSDEFRTNHEVSPCLSRKQFLTYSATLGALFALSPLVGCSSSPNSANATNASAQSEAPLITTGAIPVEQDENYGGINLAIAPDDFLAHGFKQGDSVDIALSNGKTYEDVPFFSGYYTRKGDLLLVSYAGNPTPRFTRDQLGIWDESGITKDGTITVTLREAGKYLDIEQTFNVVYSINRSDFDSDAQFANFRACSGGRLRSNLVYRSASPINNDINRAAYANALVATAGVQYSLDLADNEETFAQSAAEVGSTCQYYIDLHGAGKVETFKLTADFGGNAFKTSLSAALARMCEQPGPYLIHCLEGKDRTGFACMLVEAIAGATLDEIVADYMVTYENFFYINPTDEPLRYEAAKNVKCYDSLLTLAGVDDDSKITTEALYAGAVRYLREGGLTDAQIDRIASVLTA